MEDGVAYARLDLEHGEMFLSLRRALGVTTFGMNQLLFAPGERGRIHRHRDQEEVYLVLQGVLSLAVEGEERDLAEGELARVAPGVRRQLINRGPGRLAVLALGGIGEHASRDAEAFTSWDDADPKGPADVPFPDRLPDAELRTG
jgi:mannose-6-phosphate isomerase-like protein (cupin superfamily)